MKLNKKVLSIFFVALFAFVLAACDGVDTTLPTTEAPTTTEEVTTEAPTTTEEVTTEAPTTEAPTTIDIGTAIDQLVAQYSDTLDDIDFVATDDLSTYLTLVDSFAGYDVTWESNNTDYLANDGTVTRPLKTVDDQTVIFTVTVTDGTNTETYSFFVTVKALEDLTPEEISEEVFLVATAFPAKAKWSSADSIGFVDSVEDSNGVSHDVTWSSSHPSIITLDGTIIQPEDADTDVTITASVTIDGTEFTKDTVFTVAVLPDLDGTVTTISAAVALGEDSYVKIEGATVEAVDSEGGVYITDGVEIIFIYSPPYDVIVGESYDFYGLIGNHFNAPQLAGSDTHPLLAIASDATAKVNPIITAASINDVISQTHMPSLDNLHEYTKFTVTTSIYYEEDWGNYSVFLVPTDYDFDADLPDGATQPNGDAIMMYYKGDDEVLRAFHGQQITLDIIMQGYRTDKSIYYAVFFGTSDDVDFYFETEQDGIDAAFNALTFPKYILENETLDLPATMFKEITLTYTSDDTAVIDPTTGDVDVTGVTYQEVTLTIDATYGTTTDQMTVVIPIGVPTATDISTALAGDNGSLFQVEGVVVAGGYYNTFFIQDATGNIALYVDDDQAAILEANVGNLVNVVGARATYGGLNQLSVETVAYVSDDTAPTATNIDAMTLDTAGLADYQGQLVELTGMVITEIETDKYGNYEITLERLSDNEEILLRWDSRYDLSTEIETEMLALEVGDKVDVTTVLAWYYGPQLYYITTIDLTITELSDQDKVDLDVRYMDTELVLTEDYDLTSMFGSTISVSEMFGRASNFLDATTPGTIVVTQPFGEVLTATVTLKVMSGTVEEYVDVEVTLPALSLSALTTDLFISEYGEGSSNNKWLEIYNGTGLDADLSDYAIEYYNNGATAVTQTFELEGTLPSGEVYVLTTDAAEQSIQDIADQVFGYPSVVHFNGDDAIVLTKDGSAIDTIGVVGEDPGDSWDVGDAATKEYTLVRTPETLSPNTTFTASEWTDYPQDTFDYIGVHEVTTMTMSDAIAINADLAALDFGGTLKVETIITLPTTGENGSTIAWTVLEDTDTLATMNVTNDEVTLAEAAADTVSVVKLQAALTLNDETTTGVFVYKLEGLTDADRVSSDKTELEATDLGGVLYTGADITLPTSGTNGSTITWAITTDVDTLATLDAGALTLARAEGTESIVVLTATISLNSETATSTVTYTLKPEITDLSVLHSMTGEEYDIPTGTEVFVVGVIIADIFDGAFIQDANGNAILVGDLDGDVGDEVLASGTLDINNSVRILSSGTKESTLNTGVDLVYTVLTADEIIALDASDTGLLIQFDGLVATDLGYHAEFTVTGTSESVTLGLSYFGSSSNNSNIHDVEDAITDGDTLPTATFIFYDFSFGNTRIENLQIELTDALKYEQDVFEIPDPVMLTEDYIIGAGTLGTTWVVTGASTELTGYVDYTTTTGTLLVTRPAVGEADVTGTLTVTATNGSVSNSITINIKVLAEQPAATPDLFISEYGEGGSGNNKWIEIYNPTGSDVDLSIYTVKLNTNANDTWGNEITLSGTLAAGDVLVIYNSGSDYTNVVTEGDITSSVTFFNGDDAIGLFKNDTLIDLFGVFGEDPGSGWDIDGVTSATQDHTLVRKPSVIGPTAIWDTSQWIVYPDATDTYVGTHTTD